ncbi:MAG: NAD-dependent DNA ligase LigA [Deltaproteobacteria bacterium]|nr:NAD-dependent DNA ligase LigA [Deltaproteobacteria bacterium]
MKGPRELGGGVEVGAGDLPRVAALAERLEHLRATYYAGRPELSDAAYDALEDELRLLAPAHPVLARVGAPPAAKEWDKARHTIPMGSLNKVTSDVEFDDWLARCDELLAKEAHVGIAADLFVTEKLDGLSLELVYAGGRLVDGLTRGDAEVGERITVNVRRMRGVPERVPHEGPLSVRGEIVLRVSDRAAHFPDYASTRNAAAGTARRLDGAGCEHLTVLVYDVADELDLITEEAKHRFLRGLGFATPHGFAGDSSAVRALYREYDGGRRASLDYEIDGLVVKANDLRAQALLGELNRRPRGATAFKFPSPVKVSRVLAIGWDTGPSGRVTPVAEVEPVELVGAVVRRASLHNLAKVRRLGIGVGDEVLVSRRNDVIPYVEEVVSSARAPVEPPTACGRCGSSLRQEGEYLLCREDACPALVEGRVRNWIDATGALEWGDKLVATLVERGLVREPRDLYRLTVDDIAALDRHGKKSAENALAQLHSRLPLRLPIFLAALGIEGFSTQTARLLVAAGFKDLDRLLGATVAELAAIAGLGEIKARLIADGLVARAAEIARLRADGLGPVEADAAGPLDGKSFCMTGKQSRPRKELEQLIEDHGGRVMSGVTKDLDFLIIDDPASTSSKAVKARKYGTKLIREEDFLAMLGLSPEGAAGRE